MTVSDTLLEAFGADAIATPADLIPTIQVPLEGIEAAVSRVRDEFGYTRFVDLTAVDRLSREERFELVYLFYSMQGNAWLRLKTHTDYQAPSITPSVPGANWYEREVFDLFGIEFVGHPGLTRIMLPDDWHGFPLRRTEPLGSEPVDFTVTREVYGSS